MACHIASNQGDKLRKGPWLEEEDEQLVSFVTIFGDRKWDFIATASGLKRSGKSCRLRWLNYLRPNIKRGHISPEEEQIIIQLQEQWGNKWAKIARRLPGRTDNEIKNYWRSHLKKKLQSQQGSIQITIPDVPKWCKVNNTKPDFLYQNGDTSSWNSSNKEEYYKSMKDNIKMTATDSLLEQNELSSLTCLHSPYETRLYDWMPELSSEQCGIKINGDCGGFGSCLCLCYMIKWNAEDGDNSMLDTIGSLWNMN